MNIQFRNARPLLEDASLIMSWRNDPTTLAMFYHQEPKYIETFWVEYLQTYFAHPELPPLFAHLNGHEVAFLRSSPYAGVNGISDAVDIDINVAPDHRGKGIGAAVLDAMKIRLLQSHSCVVAEVKTINYASRRAFEKAGFHLLDTSCHVIEDTGTAVDIIRLFATTRNSCKVSASDAPCHSF